MSELTDLDFVADKIADFAPAEINFTCSYVSTMPLTFLWDFGDGQTSTDENPTHTFIRGTYKVTLTVTDGIQTVSVEKYNYIDSYTLDTFYITNVDELQAIGTPGDANLGEPGFALHDKYVQTQNIDASITSTWHSGAGFVPVPYYPNGTVDFNNVFSGIYDGGEYTITDLYINRTIDTGIGVFSIASDCTIQNSFLDVTIIGEGYVGGFIGIGKNTIKIENCSISGSISNTIDYTGGFVGQSENLEITGSHSEVGITGQDYIGGFVGLIDSGSIDDCDVDSIIEGNSYVGGLIGFGYTVDISSCEALISISSVADYIGGLIGLLDVGSISNCQATIDLEGLTYIGGIIGYGQDSITIEECDTSGVIYEEPNYVGGIVGYCYYLEITKCSSEVSIVASEFIGGCIGMLDSDGFIDDCHSTSNIIGKSFSGGIAGFSNVLVSNCSFNGSIDVIDVIDGYIGGIVGYYYASGIVRNCNAGGTIANSSYAGGLMGYGICDGLLNCYSTVEFLENVEAGSISNLGGLVGFFGRYTSDEPCSIENCYCTSSINGYNSIGGLIGYGQYVTDIINCYSTGNIQAIDDFGGQIGGLFGYANVYGNIEDCYHTSDVLGLSGTSYVGGLFGNIFLTGVLVRNCYALGDVSGSGNGLGAFIGYLIGSSGIDIDINNCYGIGDVVGNNGGYCGGFAGYLDGSFTVEKCFFRGSVENPISGFAAGGFIGFCRAKRLFKCFSISNVIGAGFGTGGFIGYADQLFGPDSTEIEQCFSIGNVTANNAAACGGFIGHSQVVECVDCFCQGDVKCYISISSASYVGGFFGYHNDPSKIITNCYFSGKIETELL